VILIRSYPPEPVPQRRNYVVDNLPRFVMGDFDYGGLQNYCDDVLLLEWDIAVSKEDLAVFIEHAKADPERVLIAPYRVYQPTSYDDELPRPVWVHRRYNGSDRPRADTASMRHVQPGDSGAHLWGMGMCYLPFEVLKRFTTEWPGMFNDGTFSNWHNVHVEPEARIDWDVHPVHLHYPIERTPL
jgi:hypothetical protein